MKTVTTIYELEVGDILHIDGFPYKYVGEGRIEGATNIITAEKIKEGSITAEAVVESKPEVPPKKTDGEMLQDLVDKLKEVERATNPLGGFRRLDPWNPPVYGPGRIGDGCCNLKF